MSLLESTPISIVAAVIRREDGWLLLVEQRGPEDLESTWALPAGQIEPGESQIEALLREVREETGLVVVGSPRLLFTTRHELAGVGEWAAATYLCESIGDVVPDDPDQVVLAADWHDPADALRLLARLEWYDTEPLRRWLSSASASRLRRDRRTRPHPCPCRCLGRLGEDVAEGLRPDLRSGPTGIAVGGMDHRRDAPVDWGADAEG